MVELTYAELTHLPLDEMAADLTADIFNRIFVNDNIWISIKISLKFVPSGPNDNKPALVQVMAWWRTGDMPLPEPMLTQSLTHICGTKGRWVKYIQH